MTRKKISDGMVMKSCDTITERSREKTSETMVIKPCSSKTQKSETALVKPCDASHKRSRKKRRVKPKEVALELEVQKDEVSTTKIRVGEHVDLKALLSSKVRNYLVSPKDGEKVPISNLEGKYVIVLCLKLPYDEDDPEASELRAMEALYTELSREKRADDVKFVVVPKMLAGSNKTDFDLFFSKLSVNCLAIPFHDSISRNNVCESLDLDEHDRSVPCLVVHPNANVLQLDTLFLENYGAQCFPFTMEHFNNIRQQDDNIKLRLRSVNTPISLTELLQCDSLSQIGDESKSIPTSQLDNTPVGLYLCSDGVEGGFMFDLCKILQKCLDNGQKLDIVLVPLPFGPLYNPQSYKRVKRWALKNSISSSWWEFPFNDKVCRTLWRFFYCDGEDELIILPHSSRMGDLWGKHIASFYGSDAYPFTRDVIVEKKVGELRSFSLPELLGDTFTSEIQNKNVLLFLDYEGGKIYKLVREKYHEIKVKHPDIEVVFVPLKPVIGAKKRRRSKKGWLILPQELCKTVIKHIHLKGKKYQDEFVKPSLVTFGKDGKILSRDARTNSLFDDTLENEIVNVIRNQAILG